MVIDGTALFACAHEFVALGGAFTCHKCKHTRDELPLTAGQFQLFFFPIPPPHDVLRIGFTATATATLS